MPRTTKSTAATPKRKPAAKTPAKPAPRKKPTTSSRGRKPAAAELARQKKSRALKYRLALTILVCLTIVILAVLGTIFYERFVPVKSPATAKKGGVHVQAPATTSQGASVVAVPVTAATPEKTPTSTPKTGTPEVASIPPQEAVIVPTAPVKPPSGKPKLAVIFDDMGNDLNAARQLEKLGVDLTFSILPFSTHGELLGRTALKNIEIMVHVPMEAINGESDKEQGLLRGNMTEAELAQVLRQDIAAVPNAKGINNHTGSKLTQQLVPMQIVMASLKDRNMFFVDSVTSDKSVAKSVAQAFLVPTIARDVFLDHVADKVQIKAQLYRAVSLAKTNGQAVLIGHPRPLSLEVFIQELPNLQKEVEFVKVSTLVK